MKRYLLTLLAALLCLMAPVQGQIKRSRAESIPELTASNTVGYGDVWSQSALSVIVRKQSGAKVEPYQAVGFGLAQNMSLFGGVVPFDGGLKQLIGKADAHFKITWPNNDNLRLFGFALQGDMVLSTEMDTTGSGTDTSRPAFLPQIGVTILADADLIKLWPEVPLKVYLNWSLIDDDRQLTQYHQQSIRFGAEWKGERHSVYLAVKTGLYKRVTGDAVVDNAAGYDETVVSLMPGVRYRVLSRFSITASAFFTPVARLLPGSRLDYAGVAFKAGLEFPLFYRETNAEAIRGMIFLERKKAIVNKGPAEGPDKRKDDINALLLPGDEQNRQELSNMLKDEDKTQEREQQLREKRKKINEELRQIEDLLE
ncbi:MAG: transporter [Fibrobacterota bacterium]